MFCFEGKPYSSSTAQKNGILSLRNVSAGKGDAVGYLPRQEKPLGLRRLAGQPYNLAPQWALVESVMERINAWVWLSLYRMSEGVFEGAERCSKKGKV